jgi:hypothetical protein
VWFRLILSLLAPTGLSTSASFPSTVAAAVVAALRNKQRRRRRRRRQHHHLVVVVAVAVIVGIGVGVGVVNRREALVEAAVGSGRALAGLGRSRQRPHTLELPVGPCGKLPRLIGRDPWPEET